MTAPAPVSQDTALVQGVLHEVARRIVGQEYMVERLLISLLTGGHVLLEGVPGLAKTLTVRTLAETVRTSFQRIQFTPDLLPADVVGTQIFDQQSGEFRVKHGPIFANIILADEINRAPAKVQAALLEAMQEKQVTIGGTTYRLAEPFLVLATQNPIEQEGTYPLPEAQVDRFMMKVLVGYPSEDEEFVIVQRVTGEPIDVVAVATTEQLAELQKECRRVYVDPNYITYAVKVVAATREPERFGLKDFGRFLTYGASPRATIHMIEGAKALAMLRGRNYVLPEDVMDIVPDVMRHRLVLSYEALAEGQTPDMLIRKVMQTVRAPDRPLESHVRVANA